MKDMTICVVGLGYIGLPTAALLATSGYHVVGVDLNPSVVETINQGRIHIVEPDLDAYVRSAVTAGRLQAFLRPQPADVYMICVPTPFHESGDVPQPNIDYVMAAARSVAPLVKAGDLVILESTSPVGTTKQMGEILQAAGLDLAMVSVAYCPERVLPGKIMVELVQNDRVVGGLTPEATHAVSTFYRTFVRGDVLETDAATAEMCKLVENSYRDVNIAFANELSLLCANAGIDVWKLIALANRHPRVNILQPGTGVGGHCIAVDPWFIVARDPANAQVIRTAREVNNRKTRWVVEQIADEARHQVRADGRPIRIACLGLAFKPDIDDLRESPALQVVEALKSQGWDLICVEPNIESHPSLPLAILDAALTVCDMVAVLVKHREFTASDRLRTIACSREIPVLDFCGALGAA